MGAIWWTLFPYHDPMLRHGSHDPSPYVSHADVPERTPSVFTVGDGVEPMLGMTPARSKKLVGAKRTRDLMSSDIGVLDPVYVDTNPSRTPLSEGA